MLSIMLDVQHTSSSSWYSILPRVQHGMHIPLKYWHTGLPSSEPAQGALPRESSPAEMKASCEPSCRPRIFATLSATICAAQAARSGGPSPTHASAGCLLVPALTAGSAMVWRLGGSDAMAAVGRPPESAAHPGVGVPHAMMNPGSRVPTWLEQAIQQHRGACR